MSKVILMLRALFLTLIILLINWVPHAHATESQTLSFDGIDFRAVNILPRQINLHWLTPDGKAFAHLGALKMYLNNKNVKVFALMNAGIYGTDNKPAGLHIEKGQVLHRLNTSKGRGNFHIQPNGVFFIDAQGKAKVVTTATYRKYYQTKQSQYSLPTQSGPMLVINGQLNRRLLAKSQSTYTRNGVCTSKDGKLLFVATDNAKSNFYQFARASQQFGCHNTLYLDGSISKLYVAGENATFHLAPFVGILSVTQP